MMRFPRVAALVTVVALTVAATPPAHAIYRGDLLGGDIDIGGRLRTINLFRHQDIDRWAFIQQRNELKLRLEWKLLQRGMAFGKYKVSWLDRADAFMVYRGIYDSIYDITPGGMHKNTDLQGDPLSPQARSLKSLDKDTRDNIKFNNTVREAYIDLYFKKLPLTMRIGKQQIVWGESDGFRMLDRANTLDLSWHFFQELPPPGFGFDELRQPFFMVKGLWDFQQLGPLSQPFLEFFWNPGDWNPGKIAFLPRPWGVNLLDPLKNSQGTGVLQSSFCSTADGGECSGLLNGTELFKQGDYDRNPIENSQFGVRFHFITPNGMEFTVNYLYQRWSPDGSPTAPVRGLPPTARRSSTTRSPLPGNQPGLLPNEQYCQGLSSSPSSFATPWAANQLCVEYFAPYIHTVGRVAQLLRGRLHADRVAPRERHRLRSRRSSTATSRPRCSVAHRTVRFCCPASRIGTCGKACSRSIARRGSVRSTSRRRSSSPASSSGTTSSTTSGAAARSTISRRPCPTARRTRPSSATRRAPTENCGSDTELLLPGEQVGLVGPLDLPKLDAPAGKGRDTIHQWELLGTLAILGFYRGGSLVPALIYLLDPVNGYSQELALGLDWFITPDIAINFTTRLIWLGAPWDAYDGHKKDTDPDNGEVFDPWFLAGGSRGRSESGLMFTWQF